MRTQDIASDLAKKFNEALNQACTHFGAESQSFYVNYPGSSLLNPW